MTDPYVDPQTLHNPSTGTSPPASWGDAVRAGIEFLARPPGCVLETTADQSGNATNGVWYNVSWNGGVDLRDTDGYHTGTSDQIVIPDGLGGWYHLAGTIVFDANAVGERLVRYSINAAGDYRLAQVGAAGSTYGTRVAYVADVLLEPGDVLRISALQTSGGALMIKAGCQLSLRMVAQP